MKHRIRYTSFLILIAICLFGCGAKSSPTNTASNLTEETSEEKMQSSIPAEKVVNAYLQAGYNNYRQSIQYTCEIELGDEENIVPSNTEIISDRAGNYVHEIQNRSVEYNDLASECTEETYMVLKDGKYKLYTSTMDQDEWYSSSTDDPVEAMQVSLSSDDFKDAICNLDKENKTYIVTVSLKDLIGSKDLYIGTLLKNTNQTDALESINKVIEADECNAVFTFSSEDLRLLSIEYAPITYSYDCSEGNITYSGSMEISFSDYWKENEEDVKVPQSIKDRATAAEESEQVEP